MEIKNLNQLKKYEGELILESFLNGESKGLRVLHKVRSKYIDLVMLENNKPTMLSFKSAKDFKFTIEGFEIDNLKMVYIKTM